MTAETRSIVLRALDEAMAMSIINLFEVLNADLSDESITRFETGLRKVVGLHDQVTKTLREEEGDAA